MKKQRINFSKKSQLHLIASRDAYRPQFQFIYFKDGFAYASDAHILIKAKISEISSFQDDQIDKLNNKLIHCSAYQKLLTYDIASITDNGFDAWMYDHNYTVSFLFGDAQEYETVKNIETVLLNGQNQKAEDYKYFGINPVLLNRLYNGYGECYGLQMFIKSDRHAIIVRFSAQSIGLIMPLMIADERV